MSRARPGAGEVSAPYEAYIGYHATSLFESDNHDLVILSQWLQHYREPVLNPYVIIISIWLEWYSHLDITPNTLRFSIYPAEAYKELVKALDDQNQSILIVTSISGASLRLRPNTPTLISDLHRHKVILPVEFRGGLSRAKLFPVPSVKHNLLLHLHEYPIPKYMRTMQLCPHKRAQV